MDKRKMTDLNYSTVGGYSNGTGSTETKNRKLSDKQISEISEDLRKFLSLRGTDYYTKERYAEPKKGQFIELEDQVKQIEVQVEEIRNLLTAIIIQIIGIPDFIKKSNTLKFEASLAKNIEKEEQNENTWFNRVNDNIEKINLNLKDIRAEIDHLKQEVAPREPRERIFTGTYNSSSANAEY